MSAPAAYSATPSVCLKEPAEYANLGYHVRQVRVTTPLGFIQALNSLISQAMPAALLKAGDPFSASLYSKGTEDLNSELRKRLGGPGRFRITVVRGALEACDDPPGANPMLDVVYLVFFFNFPQSAAPLTDTRRQEISQPTAAAADANVPGSYNTHPTMGYNAERGFFGGMNGSVAAKGAIFDNLSYGFTGSGNGTSGQANIQGSRNPGYRLLNSDTYQFGYLHSDVPSTQTSLKQSFVHARFFGESKPGAVTLRYGASFEAGNQQTGMTVQLPPEDLASAKGGQLKLVFGFTQRSANQSAALSGGLALGSTKAGLRLDYVKTVLDGEWSRTLQWPFLAKKTQPNRHYPIIVESRGGLGKISVRDHGVPVPERFFGGNTVADFIQGAPWQLRDGPNLRSIPQARYAGTGMLGGDRFAFLNLTVAPTVAAWPLVPWSVLRAKGFDNQKDLAINAGKKIDQLFYEAQQPASKKASAALESMDNDLTSLGEMLDSLAGKVPVTVNQTLADADRAAGRAERAVASARKEPAALSAVSGNVGTAVRNLKSLLDALTPLPAFAEQARKLTELHDAVQVEVATLKTNLAAIDHDDATKKAGKDFAVVEPVLNTFLYQLNRLAISPVAVFDVAHLAPDTVRARYAIGGGLRVTIFVLNLTAGYAWNRHPDPQLHIGSGAAFFSLDITQIFR